MHKYRLISKKGEGTFSEVFKAQSIKTGKQVAIKCMKNHFESIEQVNNLREIQALRRLLPHPQIVKLFEVLFDEPTGRLALVFELMDMNLYDAIKGRRYYVPEQRVKYYMYELLKAIEHMHRNGIFHRDIKPENILIIEDQVKLADFGSCRGIFSKQPYTEYISTRWYRAPECLLTDGYYGYKMDLWGVGCVIFEILALFPLFPGNDELNQIHRIHNILGTPDQDLLSKFQKQATHMEFNFPPQEGSGIFKLIPHASDEAKDLIMKLLIYNPDNRITANQALKHPWLKEIRDQEIMMKQGGGHAVTTQSVRLNPVGDSLSQYSKHSDELAQGSQDRSEHGVQKKQYSTKKQAPSKSKKLPDLLQTGMLNYDYKANQRNLAFHSDSEQDHLINQQNSGYSKQLPQIKGSNAQQNAAMNQGANLHQSSQASIDNLYQVEKKSSLNLHGPYNPHHNQSFQIHKNQSPSPSQTFFKDSSKRNQGGFMGKKMLPTVGKKSIKKP